VLDSEYLVTLMVVVPKYGRWPLGTQGQTRRAGAHAASVSFPMPVAPRFAYKDWYASYEKEITDFVVPRSSRYAWAAYRHCCDRGQWLRFAGGLAAWGECGRAGKLPRTANMACSA